MGLSAADVSFLEGHHSAAMITVAADEATVTILDGPDAPELNLRLFRQMQGKPSGPLSWFGGSLDEDQFLQQMSQEQRLIYEFDVRRSYGTR